MEPEHGMGFIEAFWLLTSCEVRHMRAPFRRCESRDRQFLYSCLKIRLISTYQGKMP